MSTKSTEMALNAERVDFTSTINGIAYRLFISAPAGAAPASGRPVVYLIDGNLHFGITVDTARIQARWPDVADPVVVGIGYQTDSVSEALEIRFADLTTPVDPESTKRGWMAAMNADTSRWGGMDAFFQVIEEEIKPRVESRVSIDRNDQTLTGHSLGGLTTLHALMRRTSMFQKFAAVSPSIWFDDRAVLKHEAAFVARVEAGDVQARALISVGEEESMYRDYPEGLPFNKDQLYAMTDATRMVPNVVELGARLAKVQRPGFAVETVVHLADDHNTVPGAGFARAIRFSQRRT